MEPKNPDEFRKLMNEKKMEREARANKPKVAWKPAALIVGIGVAVLAVVLSISLLNTSDPREEAIEACHTSISNQLKDPTSASFSNTAANETTEKMWTVTGTVRGTNSFGAIVPSSYFCEVFSGDSGTGLVLNSSIE